MTSPVVLCILDGFGYREEEANNAIKLANTPTYDRFWQTMPRAWLKTSGLAVGLPEGQMGNSEVGHMNLGSGRVIMQDLPKINTAAADGSLAINEELVKFTEQLKASGGTAHLMGLMSPGGVHSHQDHLVALAKILSDAGIKVAVHAFIDGRDTPPKSALGFLETVEAALPENASIATASGRYYAMDRDQRWDRVELAYDAIVSGQGQTADSAKQAIEASYENDVNDEFVLPTAIAGYAGIQDGDGLLMGNFRADRAREILTALVDPAFDGFVRKSLPKFAAQLGMVDYSTALSKLLPSIFPAEQVTESFGEVVSRAGIGQLRIAETEKYAHVTFFFNGGAETVFEGEDRILIPSPDVPTYDLKPEMSAAELTEKLADAITSGKYGAIVVNYANPDMVGHTGVLSAAKIAVETVDNCLATLEKAIAQAGGLMLVTADHGNVELMVDPTTGAPHTAHTDFDVPVVMVGNEAAIGDKALKDGSLSDIAPTLLDIMGLDTPKAMTGQSLLTTQNSSEESGATAPLETA